MTKTNQKINIENIPENKAKIKARKYERKVSGKYTFFFNLQSYLLKTEAVKGDKKKNMN